MTKTGSVIFLLTTWMLSIQFDAHSQSAKIWNTGDNMYSFDSNHKVTNHTLPNLNYPHAKGAVLSTMQGIPLFVANRFNIQSLQNGEIIANSDSMIFESGQNAFFQRNDSVYDLLYYFSKQEYLANMKAQYEEYNALYNGYLYDDLINFPDGYYSQAILVTNEGMRVIEKNRLVLEVNIPTYTAIHSIIRISDYSYRIIGHQTEDFLVSMRFENGILTVEGGIRLPEPYALFDEPIPIPFKQRMYHKWSPAHITVNFSNDRVFYIQRLWIGKDTLGGFVPFYEHMSLFEMKIDPKSGIFTSNPKEIYSVQEESVNWIHPDKKTGTYHYLHKIVISPNDSILYFLNTKENVTKQTVGHSSVFEHEIYTYRYKDLTPSPELAHTFTSRSITKAKDNLTIGMQLSPYGKIAFLFYNGLRYNNVSPNAKVLFLNETNNPTPGELSFIESNVLVRKPFIRLYDYQKYHQKIELSCSAKVTIQNHSDFSGGMDHFTWEFTLEDGSKDTSYGMHQTRFYSKSGIYPYKVRGYSSRGTGYGEFYLDTIKVDIPPKPVALFSSSDSTVCRYLPITFYNESVSQDTNPNIKRYWEWDFGDGVTRRRYSLQDEVYAYQDSGVFTVSLTYFNGYCDSVLIRSKMIRVIDAPRSGFTVSDSVGCTPFLVEFTDTIWREVERKEYFFGDSNIWKPITNTHFSHLFAQVGNHKVIQKLYGKSGCIITTDSMNFHVMKGMLPTDTIEVINATYETNNQILVHWEGIDAAASYDVYRDNELISNIKDTFYIDNVAKPNVYSYHIIATDSCQNSSKLGNKASPIFLQGEVQDFNEYSELSFTEYKGWVSPLNYEIWSIIDNNPNVLIIQNDTSPYLDKHFLEQGRLEKCYRIKGTEIGTNKSTFSNTLCLPYVPFLFAPTAISLNQDNLNDSWKAQYVGFENITVTIFNRWGESIFYGENENPEWLPEASLPQGVYIYVIHAKDINQKPYIFKGTITIIK